jgi:hypothetical protein
MLKKTAIIASAAAFVMAAVLIAVGNPGQVSACDGKAKSAAAKASACTKSASAAKVSAATAGSSSCAGTAKSSCTRTTHAKTACCADQAKQAHYMQVKKAADMIPYRVNTRLVLTGTYKCGSCDLGVTDKCQAFIKTTDGHLYPLEKSKNVKNMYASGNKKFEITARVSKQYGAKYLDVTNYHAL